MFINLILNRVFGAIWPMSCAFINWLCSNKIQIHGDLYVSSEIKVSFSFVTSIEERPPKFNSCIPVLKYFNSISFWWTVYFCGSNEH